MTTMALESHVGLPIPIDLCTTCHALWFDERESVQLSPASTLRIFRIIGDQAQRPSPMAAEGARCPRCRAQLVLTHDRQRDTRFEYLRCPRGHGRLVTFLNFLREKDFIRPLSPEQIEELRQNVQEIHCANCGAPIDLARTSACSHCGSPLSMLDLKQAGRVVEQLTRASGPKPLRPELLLDLARARRDTEAAFADGQTRLDWWREVSADDAIAAGVNAVMRLLKG